MRNPIIQLSLTVIILLLHSNMFAQGFLRADGINIVDGNGNNFVSRSIGTGNWMIQEGYMMQSTGAGINTQWQFREKLIETIGEARTDTFYNAWLANHFTRADVDSMKAWGFNSVRPALHYNLFTPPIEDEPVSGEITWLDKGFEMLDSLIAWCRDNEMYVFLDMHGAPGGQGKNMDICDYDPSKPSLWESEHNLTKLTALWYEIAKRYKDEPWVGGFDLINEINWDFENSGNENGCNCKHNKPIIDIFERMIDTIRTVNTNHIVFVSGNCWGNNYSGMDGLADYDDNLVYTFHKYWSFNTPNSLDWIIERRDRLNVPLWMSESGENSNTWFTNATSLFEANNIGWSWWPVKKSGINNVLRVIMPPEYTDLLNYWQNGSPQMSETQAFEAVMKWNESHKIENCIIQYDVIDALTRQINSYEAIPFKKHVLGEEIFFTDYDLGRNNVAYFDTDTANHHIDTGNYTAWNQGWGYRNDGVDIEPCNDTEVTNGYNVGWTAEGEWMQYTVNSDSTAAFTLEVRHASGNNGSRIQVQVNNIDVSGLLTLPSTGGWQNWKTATFDDIILPAGENKIRFKFDQGGSNLNFFVFTNPKSADEVGFKYTSSETSANGEEIFITLNKEVTTANNQFNVNDFELLIDSNPAEIIAIEKHSTASVIVLKTSANIYSDTDVRISYSGTTVNSNTQTLEPFSQMQVKNNLPTSYPVPGRIEAEDYYVNHGFVFENCEDTGGGLNSAFAKAGNYLEYNIRVAQTGNYNLNYRVATERNNAELVFMINNTGVFKALDTIQFASTGGWQNWQTQSSSVYLEEGYYKIRLQVKQGEHNLNWFELTHKTSSVSKPALFNSIELYPNPASSFVELVINNELREEVTASIFNSRGQAIDKFNVNQKHTLIDTSSFPKGIYHILVQNSSQHVSKKLIVN